MTLPTATKLRLGKVAFKKTAIEYKTIILMALIMWGLFLLNNLFMTYTSLR